MSRAAMPPATKAKSSVDKEKAVPNKKRKAAKGSQGVENLKKVNTRGMTKISSFFNKKP
jgi:ribonuclease H2 subunit B